MNEDKNNNQLPKDWKWVRLGEYVISVKGKKPKRVSKEKTIDCSIPYVNIKAFERNIIDEYTDGVGCILCEDGDFLMVWDGSRSGYVGKAIKGALGSTLVKLNFPDIDNNYAFYFLQSKYLGINTRAKGVGIPHVDPNILWNYDLLIPPKPTQQAIVSKIEELFSELDKGIENLQIAQEQLKIYRQAVLKWAFEGRLTNENVKEDELPEGWKMDRLGGHIEKISSGKSYRCNERPPNIDEVGIVKVSSVSWGFFDENESKTCSSKDLLNANHLIENEDFLFSRANTIELVGACVIVKKIGKKLMLSDKILRFTFSNDLSKEFALYYLRSRKGRKQIEMLSTGNQDSMRNIAQEKIRQIEVPFCLGAEQKNVVQSIESRLSVADKMEESITQSLQQAEALRQSILKKAFEGRLV
jgi:type I restriction enzyme, S subunit